MRPFVDGAGSVILNHPAGEDDPPIIVCGFKFEPDIESINRASWKEVSDLFCPDHNIDAIRITGTNYRIHSIERRRQWSRFRTGGRAFHFPLLADSKCRGEAGWQRSAPDSPWLARSGNTEDVHGQDSVLQEFRYCVQLPGILVRNR